MSETQTPTSTPASIARRALFTHYFNHYSAKFPGIAATDTDTIVSFATYAMERDLNGGTNVTAAPLVPARISQRHPLAH